jgi:hypothetical protein
VSVIVRELRVTDICCPCGAGSGERCKEVLVEGQAQRWQPTVDGAGMFHAARFNEFKKLVAEGWQWQEVNPRDVNPGRK